MVVGAFPAVKLGVLFMKQISKPIANFAKERAKNHPFFRAYILMPPAQFYNWCEVKTKMWVMNLGKPTKIPNLNEAMAIELGANLLGETIVFSIAAGILYFEYSRQAQKELLKEKNRQEELSTLNYTIQQLYFTVERQDAQIRELLEVVTKLEKSHKFARWGKDQPPSHPPPPPPPKLILPPTPLVPISEAVVAAQREDANGGKKIAEDNNHNRPDSKAPTPSSGDGDHQPSTEHSFIYEALASLQVVSGNGSFGCAA